MKTNEAESSGHIPANEPNWQRLEQEQQSQLPSDEQIQAFYDAPGREVHSSADAAIDVEIASRRVNEAFEQVGGEEGVAQQMQQETKDRAALEGHPDAPALSRIGLNADTETYNDQTTDSMIERMQNLGPGQNEQIMHFPTRIPQGFESSDGLKQLVAFFDKAGITALDIPAAGAKASKITPDGRYAVTISVDKGPDGAEMITVTAEGSRKDVPSNK